MWTLPGTGSPDGVPSRVGALWTVPSGRELAGAVLEAGLGERGGRRERDSEGGGDTPDEVHHGLGAPGPEGEITPTTV
jgi:hypothetical protein